MLFRLREFRYLWPWFRRELWAYAIGAVLIVVACYALVVIPELIATAIGRLSRGEQFETIATIAWLVVAAILVRAVALFFQRMIMIGASRRIEFRLKNHMFRHIESLDMGFYVRTHTGDLISRFTNDMDAVRQALGPGVMYTITTATLLTFVGQKMLSKSLHLTLYCLLPLILLTFVIRYLSPRVHAESLKSQERLSDLSVHAQENFSNVKVIKSFVREEPEIERMDTLSDAYFAQNMKLARLRSLTMALLWLVGDLAVLALVAGGGYEIVTGSVTLEDFAAFIGFQFILVWPMIALGWVMTLFQRGAASAQRLRAILEAKPEIDDSEADPAARISEGSVQCENVTFAYPSQNGHNGTVTVLKDVDFNLPARGTLGVVGPTGCGKSTLLQLIPRLQLATEGTIRIDGRAVANYSLASLRDEVGLVPQEPFLFSATVEENITFGVDDASVDDVHQVARVVSIHDEILEFPYGYSQRVGERGITLSGGQKQRIALARALLKRPRVLLLDDVLSAVDAHTETRILEGIREWTRDLTTVIVSHRLSAVRHADEILVLRDGAVQQRGNHRELVRNPGYYANLFQRQSLEDELEEL